jgi:hypothetical protein
MDQIYTNCNHWMLSSCPQRCNESMIKTEPKDPAIHQNLTTYDYDVLKELCASCPKFKGNS